MIMEGKHEAQGSRMHDGLFQSRRWTATSVVGRPLRRFKTPYMVVLGIIIC